MDGKEQIEGEMEVEFHSQSGKICMQVSDTNAPYQSNINEMEIDPLIVDIKSLKINRNGTEIKFISPLLVSTDGEIINTNMLGFKVNGETPNKFFDDVDSFHAHNFSKEWFSLVEKQRKRIEDRRKRINNI